MEIQAKVIKTWRRGRPGNEASTYQEVQFVLHVLEEASHHGSQMYHMGRTVLLKQCSSGSHVTVCVQSEN